MHGTCPRHFSGGSIHDAPLKTSLEIQKWNNFINWNFLGDPFSTSLAASARWELPGCCTTGLGSQPNLPGLGLAALRGGGVPDPIPSFDSA